MTQAYLLLRLALERLGPLAPMPVAKEIAIAMDSIWTVLTPEQRSALVTMTTNDQPGMHSGV